MRLEATRLVDDLLIPALLLFARRLGVARDLARRRVGAAGRGGADADAVAGIFEGQRGGQRVRPRPWPRYMARG